MKNSMNNWSRPRINLKVLFGLSVLVILVLYLMRGTAYNKREQTPTDLQVGDPGHRYRSR